MTSSKWDRPGSRKGMVSARYDKGMGRSEHLDILIGFVGFVVVVCLVITVIAEVQGKSAWLEVGVLLLFLLPLGALIRLRKKLGEQPPPD